MADDLSHSHYFYRHKGRVAKYRELVSQAGTELTALRVASRAASQSRALKHYNFLQALEKEKELERLRCQLCDIVKAEAFGLGHSNWLQRQCSQCFAVSAERSARMRHMGPLADPPDHAHEVHEVDSDALLFRIAAAEQRLSILGVEPGESLYSHPPEPCHAHRSARVDQHSSFSKAGISPQREQTDVLVDRGGGYPGAYQDVGTESAVENSRGMVSSPLAADSGECEDPRSKSQADIQSEDSSESSSGPNDSTRSPRHGFKGFSLPPNTSSNHSNPSRIGQKLGSNTPTSAGIDEQVRGLMESLRKGDKQAILEGLLASKDLEGLLADVLLPDAIKSSSQDDTLTTPNNIITAPEVPPECQKTAFERLRDELKQAELGIAFAPTQAERSHALHVAFDLRRGLAELSGLQRKEERMRAMQVGRGCS